MKKNKTIIAKQNKPIKQTHYTTHCTPLIASKIASEITSSIPYYSLQKKFQKQRQQQTKQNTIRFVNQISQSVCQLATFQYESKKNNFMIRTHKHNKSNLSNNQAQTLRNRKSNKQQQISSVASKSISQDSIISYFQECDKTIKNQFQAFNSQRRMSKRASMMKLSREFLNFDGEDRQSKLGEGGGGLQKIKKSNKKKLITKFKNKENQVDKKQCLIKLKAEEEQDLEYCDYIEKLRSRKNKLAEVMNKFVKIQNEQVMKSQAQQLSHKVQTKQNQKPIITNFNGELIKIEKKDQKKEGICYEKQKIKLLFKLRNPSLPIQSKVVITAQDEKDKQRHSLIPLQNKESFSIKINEQQSKLKSNKNKYDTVGNSSKEGSDTLYIKSIMDVLNDRKTSKNLRKRQKTNENINDQ